MRPKSSVDKPSQGDLFRARLVNLLNLNHEVCQLADNIEWEVFDERYGALYDDSVGRPGLCIRLMVGLTYLQRAFNVSDESVVATLLENGYWQYFCGFEYFLKTAPLDDTSLPNFRKRLGADELELMLTQTIETARRGGLVTEQTTKCVNVDTTVMEKAIAYPTDSRLSHKATKRLVKEAKSRGIELRQSYKRLGKRALLMQGRYSHARQFKRARREQRRLKNYLGRIIRDIGRKCPNPDNELKNLLALASRIYTQKRQDTKKLYAIHSPEVECIAKGKAHKRFEFGCKVSVATTSKDNWVVGISALHGNPFDGHTLKGAIEQIRRITGTTPAHAYCDKGYKGADKLVKGTRVQIGAKGWKKATRTEKSRIKRRAAVEPIIGHLKSDNRMNRNYLKGKEGDRINAILAGCGFNLRKLLRAFLRLTHGWFFKAVIRLSPDIRHRSFA